MKSVYVLWNQNGLMKIFSTLKAAQLFYSGVYDKWIEINPGSEWVAGLNHRITCESVD